MTDRGEKRIGERIFILDSVPLIIVITESAFFLILANYLE